MTDRLTEEEIRQCWAAISARLAASRCDRCRHWVPEEGEPDGVCKELSEWTDPDFYCGYWEA